MSTSILKDKKATVAILNRALSKLVREDDGEDFLLLIKQLAKLNGGMSSLSKKVGINRQNLYRSFAQNANPKIKSLAHILQGLGYRISVEPIEPSTKKP